MSLTSRTYSQAVDEPIVQWTFVDPLQELPSAVLPSWDGPNLGVKPPPRPAYIMADAKIRGPICDIADCKSLDIYLQNSRLPRKGITFRPLCQCQFETRQTSIASTFLFTKTRHNRAAKVSQGSPILLAFGTIFMLGVSRLGHHYSLL